MIELESDLPATLAAFRERVQTSPAVKRLLERWDRTIELRVAGGERAFFLRSQGGDMLPPLRSSAVPGDVVIEAGERVLAGIFKGEINPARAHLDGELVAQGSQRDQLVLDAIVLLLWGA